MKKLILISALLFSFKTLGIGGEPIIDNPHLFSLKCDGSEIPWGYWGENKNYYIDVYADIDSAKNDEDWSKDETNADAYMFYQSERGPVYWHELGDKLVYEPDEYLLTYKALKGFWIGDHPFQNFNDPDGRRVGYKYFLGHAPSGPHSIKVNRLTLEVLWTFDENPTYNRVVWLEDYGSRPFGELLKFNSKCVIAEEGGAMKWQSEINQPIEEAAEAAREDKRKEILENRKL